MRSSILLDSEHDPALTCDSYDEVLYACTKHKEQSK